MSRMVRWMDERFYAGIVQHWDDDQFRDRILVELRPDSVVLDIGAGAGILPQMDFRDHAGRVCGIDPDARVVENPHLHEGKVSMGESIPYPDATFDIVFCDNVLEHLERPGDVFEEVARVLKPGGTFLAKTPNAWHYMPLVARLTPHRFHQWFNEKRGRARDDTFPTLYRANTRRKIGRLAEAAGLSVRQVEMLEGRPEYLRFHPLTYVPGLVFERLVNAGSLFAGFRVVLVAILDKSGPG